MSMNLYLEFLDDKGRCVKLVDLIQTPTSDTMEILGYHPPSDTDFETVRYRYFKWVAEHFDRDILELEKDKIQEATDRYSDDYKPSWYML